MLNQLTWERYKKSSEDERKAFVDEAERMISEYGWEDRTVSPWGSGSFKITKFLDYLKDLDSCTPDSKSYVIDVVNGMAEVMNAWEEHEKEPKVMVRSLNNGKVIRLSADFAKILLEAGEVVLI